MDKHPRVVTLKPGQVIPSSELLDWRGRVIVRRVDEDGYPVEPLWAPEGPTEEALEAKRD